MGLDNIQYMFSCGCSHFAGSELVQIEKGEPFPEALALAVPGRVAEKLQLNYVNTAEPGGSNDYIFRKTIDWVSNYLSGGHDPSKLFVLIGWSTDERMEFTWEGKSYHWANGSAWEPYYSEGRGPNFENWFKALQLYHTDFEFGRYKKIINIIALDRFLKLHGIKYAQVATCGKISDDAWGDNKLKHLQSAFPFDTFFEPDDSFIDQYLESHASHFTPWVHADSTLHDMYAEKLVNFIKETYE